MAERGFDGKTIGLALDRDPEAVRKKCVALGIQLRPASLNSRRFKLKSRTWIALEAWARRLRTKPSKLARQIVEVVIEEDLLSAVLDLPPSLRLETSSIERKWAARLAGRNFGDAPQIGQYRALPNPQ